MAKDELHDGMKRVYAGAFNVMSQEWQGDGTCIVTIHSHDDTEALTMHVYDLYGEAEYVGAEVTNPLGAPTHIQERMDASVDVAAEFESRPRGVVRPTRPSGAADNAGSVVRG